MIKKNAVKNNRFYDSEKNVKEYIESCEGKDRIFLIEELKKHLPLKSNLLELGMGAGIDLDILNQFFNATGSDNSQSFLDIYKQRKQSANLLFLDAVTLETNRKFNCIYSNKVLHHLTKSELIKSFQRQQKLLKSNAILFHSFWRGTKKEIIQDLCFFQYEINELKELIKNDFEIIEIEYYKDLIEKDSIYLILRNKKPKNSFNRF